MGREKILTERLGVPLSETDKVRLKLLAFAKGVPMTICARRILLDGLDGRTPQRTRRTIDADRGGEQRGIKCLER